VVEDRTIISAKIISQLQLAKSDSRSSRTISLRQLSCLVTHRLPALDSVFYEHATVKYFRCRRHQHTFFQRSAVGVSLFCLIWSIHLQRGGLGRGLHSRLGGRPTARLTWHQVPDTLASLRAPWKRGWRLHYNGGRGMVLDEEWRIGRQSGLVTDELVPCEMLQGFWCQRRASTAHYSLKRKWNQHAAYTLHLTPYVSAAMAFTYFNTCDFHLWPLNLKTFSAMFTHIEIFLPRFTK